MQGHGQSQVQVPVAQKQRLNTHGNFDSLTRSEWEWAGKGKWKQVCREGQVTEPGGKGVTSCHYAIRAGCLILSTHVHRTGAYA